MTKLDFTVGNIECTGYFADNASVLLLQPVDEHDLEVLDAEVEYISGNIDKEYSLVAFSIKDWNKELSPWEAPPVFGKVGFGNGAEETLQYIENQLLPYIFQNHNISKDIPVILGGYSLAGLFALWSSYQSDSFAGVAAASPSVWFPGFIEYAKSNSIQAPIVYLSLGDKEDKAKNPTMATVGTCITELSEHLKSQQVDTILEWNEGNHFKDSQIRTAKAFAWCMKKEGL